MAAAHRWEEAVGKAVEAADGTWTSGMLSAQILPHSTSPYHLILYDPHVQVITPVLKALVCLISYVCSCIFLYPCTVNYTPKNIDDCINHWCYIIYYRCTRHLFLAYFTILIPCFVFVGILLYMRQKAVNVTMISSSTVGAVL